MKKIFRIILIILIFVVQIDLQANEIKNYYNVKEDTTWKYLGRPRPGMTPLRFPPDSLLANNNWMWHGTPIFSPDLKEIHWCKYDRIVDRGMIVFIKYTNNNWTSMQFPPFGNQNYFESSPVYSYSGDTVFFSSGRPGAFILRVCRTSNGWTTPENVNIPIPSGYLTSWEFSIARNGTIYFALYNNNLNVSFDIFKSKLIGGQYQIPENLGNVINSDSSDAIPCIDPDERFIIFASKRPGGFGLHDLYISKRKPDSTWNIPINLGPTVNTYFEDGFPSITPDNQYFFFTTAKYNDIGYNPYWINMQYINNLISIGINNQTEIVNDFELSQNYPNPFNPSTKIKFRISKKEYVKLNVYDIQGKEVEELVNKELNPGNYEVTFSIKNIDNKKLSTGIYFYSLIAGNKKITKKMAYVK